MNRRNFLGGLMALPFGFLGLKTTTKTEWAKYILNKNKDIFPVKCTWKLKGGYIQHNDLTYFQPASGTYTFK